MSSVSFYNPLVTFYYFVETEQLTGLSQTTKYLGWYTYYFLFSINRGDDCLNRFFYLVQNLNEKGAFSKNL